MSSPIRAAADRAAEWPGDSVAALLGLIGGGTGAFENSPDGGLGLALLALAGLTVALAVAILLSVVRVR